MNYILSLHFWCEELVDADPILDFWKLVYISPFSVCILGASTIFVLVNIKVIVLKKKKKLNAVFAEELPHTLCVNEKRTPNW